MPQLTADVTWFNRTNDVQIRALLQPGTDFGLTDLQFAVTEPPRNTLQFFTDNQGVKTTGRYQAGVYYKLHGLAGFDDRLTFYGTKSDGNLNGNVSYNVPVNPWGGRVGVSYTQGKIKIVDGPVPPLDVTGKSDQVAVNFAQPVFVNEAGWCRRPAHSLRQLQQRFRRRRRHQRPHQQDHGRAFGQPLSAKLSRDLFAGFNSMDWHDKILASSATSTSPPAR